ncbi:MAG: hypothetical protein UZ14_CFX002002961 [Chloroflexi bacterium OLB14]|nr:MAG: hypothetical protein UZ14_CFX002002961 [Chloroflexi bacterium OLB14]
MNKRQFWEVGQSATLRGVGEKVFWAYPTIVVKDTSDLLALYMPAGVIGKDTDHKPTPQELFAIDKINIFDYQWVRTDVLILNVPTESFSTYIMWNAGTKDIDCWYVNLQEPVQHTRIGFDTMDNMLDVVISPDMNEWHWKDKEEFEQAQKVGFYSAEKAREIWATGEKAIQLITKERRVLYEQWKDWQPNPEWEFPKLSPDWQKVNLD